MFSLIGNVQARVPPGTRVARRRKGFWFALRALLNGPASDRRLVRYRLGEVAARWIGGCWVPEDQKSWLQDDEFWRAYRRFEPHNARSAERKFAVYQLVRSLDEVAGDTAECGAFAGATSHFICAARATGWHHIFDSFAGLSSPVEQDAVSTSETPAWQAGDLASPLESLRANLADFDRVAVYPGWIPERFAEVGDRRFCFVHIDVDLYQPTRDSLTFFYPRIVEGGMLVCDDYGYLNCPGAKRACDEFAASIPEPLVHLPTGQALIIKR